ncbi:MAG: hypothetical protein IT443_09310 [Phycisphaeraceae bacterium]|nr:hypothetical protein [Phycisphaeraceae bacterium]
MTWQIIQKIWPILAVLVYILVTCVLGVLAYMRKHEIDLHDRVRESLVMRNKYLQTIEDHKAMESAPRR